LKALFYYRAIEIYSRVPPRSSRAFGVCFHAARAVKRTDFNRVWKSISRLDATSSWCASWFLHEFKCYQWFHPVSCWA